MASVQQKRLADSELAAEYYAQDSKCRHEQWVEAVRGDDYTDREREGQERMHERLNTLYRFATTPHHEAATAHSMHKEGEWFYACEACSGLPDGNPG